jgi:hypothetical protein
VCVFLCVCVCVCVGVGVGVGLGVGVGVGVGGWICLCAWGVGRVCMHVRVCVREGKLGAVVIAYKHAKLQ